MLGIGSVHTGSLDLVLDSVEVCHSHALWAHGPSLSTAKLDVLGHPLVLVEGALQGNILIISIIYSDYTLL